MAYDPTKSGYWHEYPDSYSFIDVREKTIVDIGADAGSSAHWFLLHGAKKVICFSNEPQEYFDSRVEWRGAWNGEYVPADVLKIDCEGCECMLTISLIRMYAEYYIAIHTFAGCYAILRDYLEGDGKLVFTTPDKVEWLYAKRL